jgi:hypothetical protein
MVAGNIFGPGTELHDFLRLKPLKAAVSARARLARWSTRLSDWILERPHARSEAPALNARRACASAQHLWRPNSRSAVAARRSHFVRPIVRTARGSPFLWRRRSVRRAPASRDCLATIWIARSRGHAGTQRGRRDSAWLCVGRQYGGSEGHRFVPASGELRG